MMEETAIMLPSPLCLMAGAAARQTRMTPLRSFSWVWSYFSSVSWVRGTLWAMPAFATTQSSGP
jgi:hypothetical protein